MRRSIAFGAAFSLILVTSPALASPCPKDREAAAALIESLPELEDASCSYPCADAYDYDASGLTILGVKPDRVQRRLERSKEIQSVIFQLPGRLSRHSAAFKKAFSQSTCASYGDHCWWTEQNRADDKLVQVNLFDNPRKNTTDLHCNFEFLD